MLFNPNDLSDCFDKDYIFDHNGYTYEMMGWEDNCRFRVVLAEDDYDYIEDEMLIEELSVIADRLFN